MFNVFNVFFFILNLVSYYLGYTYFFVIDATWHTLGTDVAMTVAQLFTTLSMILLFSKIRLT